MKKHLFAFVTLAAMSGPALSQSPETYLLSLPLRTQGDVVPERCTRAAVLGEGFCNTVNLTIPGTTDPSVVTIYFRMGQLKEFHETNWGDFVPWPWSDLAGNWMEYDFTSNPTLPVIANPCFGMDCAPGNACKWDSEQPLRDAECFASPAMGNQRSLLGGFFTLGSIKKLQMQVSLLDANAARTPKPIDENICGKAMELKTCLGTHVKDEEGRIWAIP